MSVSSQVSRREWRAHCLAQYLGVLSVPLAAAQTRRAERATIETVTGPIDPARLGLTLMHEHVLVDFIGAADVSPSRYDADAVFKRALPHLERVRTLGGATIVECTPAYLGRDPRLLKRLAEASGLQILTNTGYYGANKDKHLPPHAFTETAEQLAARWIREWEQGIDGTGIKPAFMKIGVDAGPLSEIDAKLVRAAAIAHKATGLTIAAHTGNGVAAFEEFDLLEQAGVARARRRARRVGRVRRHQREERRSPRGARDADARRRSSRSRPRLARCRLVSRR
jgi:predicted metal-dependent phosphotriesterase family hydrolase